MKNILFIGMLLFAVACGKNKQESKLPNIVVILADDLGYGDPTCYNPDSKIPTPNIDKLAAEGLSFTDAHSASAVCTPTRYSILTGRYAWRTSLKKGVLWAWDKPLIAPDRLTLPKMLKEKGYQTAVIGKWHLGWQWPTNDTLSVKEQNGENVDYTKEINEGPLSRGFDYYFGDDVPNFPPYTFIENKKVVKIPTVDKPNSLFGGKGKMAEGWTLEGVMPEITQKSVEYINRASKNNEPFFLYFALTAPHTPIAPAAQFEGKSKAGRYGDFVYEVDWSVGQIISALEENGINDNTLVIFTSDNGSPARNGENWSGPTQSVITDYGHNPSKNLRGMKGDIWEGGHRIPFIAKWEGKIAKGRKTPALTCSMDLMPTIAEIVDYNLPQNASEDGKSLYRILTEGLDNGREMLVNHSHRGVFALRKGDWKLILSNKSGGFSDSKYPEGFGIETPGQLYNLKNDPGEKENLYTKFPEKVEELTKDLEQIKNK
ncbi:arylsulfatase [Prolixibacteraceae bacterium Z1-6]|uniref:Arylsulfatase n=1 Tax=Draconibacterium aestuarii TaxID=2998507 RepID=A0A9X3J8V8_9BACT|nr:arylsulfatase [Prolixibacteraceae bacterium Z1-6]